MAWFPCRLGGGPTPTENVNASYIKWRITQTRSNPAGSSLQIAEFYLYLNNSKYSWHNNVSITSTMAGNTNEGIDKLIDGSIFTKYCTNGWGSSQNNTCDIVISLGETITLDGDTAYSFVTANDEASRDPASWKMYASIDGINWIEIDSRDSVAVTTDRQTETSKFYLDIQGTGNATVAEGTFTSASTQYGIVDVVVGFEPDLVMVFMKLSGGSNDTCSYWEKDASWAQTSAIWCLWPAEASSYQVALGREFGETGIQAINNDGFSYMSNGNNTQGCICNYIAVKYAPVPMEDAQVVDISSFTQEYDSTIPFGDSGSKISWLLSNITTLEELLIQSNTSWDDSRNAFYDLEDQTGAYAGFSSNDTIDVDEVLLQLGRYEAQNQSLFATMQYKNTSGSWVDIDDEEISTTISYPKHLVRVNLRNYTVKGFRFIHKESPIKSSGNNIIFGGMIALKGSYTNVTNFAVVSVGDAADSTI